MTWKELAQYIQEMPQRFLDINVRLYNSKHQRTYSDGQFYNDATEDDYTIDLDQPEIWFDNEDLEPL